MEKHYLINDLGEQLKNKNIILKEIREYLELNQKEQNENECYPYNNIITVDVEEIYKILDKGEIQ